MRSREWRTTANLKSAAIYPNMHVLRGNLTLFDSDGKIQIYNGVTWEIAAESLKKGFIRGFSVKVPCH